MLSKTGAYVILRILLNLPIELPDLPKGSDHCPVGVETVVFAEEVKPRGGVKLEVIIPEKKSEVAKLREIVSEVVLKGERVERDVPRIDDF